MDDLLEAAIRTLSVGLAQPRTPKSRKKLFDGLEAAGEMLAESRMAHLLAVMAGRPCGCG